MSETFTGAPTPSQDPVTRTPMADARQMPVEIAVAILSVMDSVETLERSEENKNGGYRFAGIEAFYEAIRPLLVEAGLIVHAEEESTDWRTAQNDRGNNRTFLVMRYTFHLNVVVEEGEADAEGEFRKRIVSWRDPLHRTAMVDAAMGSQAFGAAQSYAEKLYLRSLFKISTGDAEDADRADPTNLPPQQRHRGDDFPGDRPMDNGRQGQTQARGGPSGGQGSSNGTQQRQGGQASAQRGQAQGRDQAGTKSAAQAKRDGDWEHLQKTMNMQRTEEELKAWYEAKKGMIGQLSPSWQSELRTTYRDHMAFVQELEWKALEGQVDGDPSPPADDTDPPPPT